MVTEYRAQVLEDENGNRYVAPFPEGVTKAVQYGTRLKAHAVYLSQFQLIPYNRIQDYFADQLHIPISEGSIFNFNKQAFDTLDAFENIAKEQLKTSAVAHADETGINKGGARYWLHCVSNGFWTLYYPPRLNKKGKRGRIKKSKSRNLLERIFFTQEARKE